MRAKSILIRNNQYLRENGGYRTVAQIELFIGGMWFSKDLNNERDEKLADKLAEASGIELNDFRRGHVSD